MIAMFTGGWVPPWFSDPFWAKVGILLIQTWLGFPYMFVVVTGALQTLPNDIYEAADLDGANAWHKFQSMTLPLLLVTVGPLLVASFAFNFNNFTVIDLYNSGGPPMPNVPTPVGYTDILATYTYNIAFGSQGTQDYGYASAITMHDLPDPVRHHPVPVPLHQHAGREGAQCLRAASPLRWVRSSGANALP